MYIRLCTQWNLTEVGSFIATFKKETGYSHTTNKIDRGANSKPGQEPQTMSSQPLPNAARHLSTSKAGYLKNHMFLCSMICCILVCMYHNYRKRGFPKVIFQISVSLWSWTCLTHSYSPGENTPSPLLEPRLIIQEAELCTQITPHSSKACPREYTSPSGWSSLQFFDSFWSLLPAKLTSGPNSNCPWPATSKHFLDLLPVCCLNT